VAVWQGKGEGKGVGAGAGTVAVALGHLSAITRAICFHLEHINNKHGVYVIF